MPRSVSVLIGTPRGGQLWTPSLTDNIGISDSVSHNDGTANFPTAANQVGAPGGSTSQAGFTASDGQVFDLSERIINGNVFVEWGSSVTLTDCTINGGVVVVPREGQSQPELVLDSCRITNGMSVNPLDAAGSTLYWGGPLDVVMDITRCWIQHPVAFEPDHVEALAGFGFPSGARFTSTAFIQYGAPGLANGVTGVTNWYGHDTIFDDCLFGWDDTGPAAFFVMYNRPEASGGHTNGGNTVRNCAFQSSGAGYIYDGNAGEGYSHALYEDCYEYDTGDPLTLPD